MPSLFALPQEPVQDSSYNRTGEAEIPNEQKKGKAKKASIAGAPFLITEVVFLVVFCATFQMRFRYLKKNDENSTNKKGVKPRISHYFKQNGAENATFTSHLRPSHP